jgi:hypothetical protein
VLSDNNETETRRIELESKGGSEKMVQSNHIVPGGGVISQIHPAANLHFKQVKKGEPVWVQDRTL